MNLGEQNRLYWGNYTAGTTPGIDAMPSANFLRALPEEARILDVGTGTGTLAEALANLGFKAFGIDLNKNEINEKANRKTQVKYST